MLKLCPVDVENLNAASQDGSDRAFSMSQSRSTISKYMRNSSSW